MKASIFKVYDITHPPYVEVRKVWEGDFSTEMIPEIRKEIARKIKVGVNHGHFYIIFQKFPFAVMFRDGFPRDEDEYREKGEWFRVGEIIALAKVVNELEVKG